MTGQWGQANYNAGNTFLDAFVSYRHSLGLAASAVNIGVVGDIGYVSEHPSVLDSLRATGQYIMMEAELLDCLELVLKRSRPTPGGTAARRGCGKKQTASVSAVCRPSRTHGHAVVATSYIGMLLSIVSTRGTRRRQRKRLEFECKPNYGEQQT